MKMIKKEMNTKHKGDKKSGIKMNTDSREE